MVETNASGGAQCDVVQCNTACVCTAIRDLLTKAMEHRAALILYFTLWHTLPAC